MIVNAPYGVEPWTLTEDHLDLNLIAQSESVFALSNGHIGLRGNLDEGEPFGLPGTYLNSVYEERPLPYAEAGYGYPETGQTVINVTNGKIIRLLVDDEPFDIRYGTLESHVRRLDLRAGTLTRDVEWTSPAGRRVKVQLRPAGVADPAGDRGDLLHGDAARRASAPGPHVLAGGERGHPHRLQRPAGRVRARPPAGSRGAHGQRRGEAARGPGAPHARQRPGGSPRG